jgi:DNA mismatch repair protein MSH6
MPLLWSHPFKLRAANNTESKSQNRVSSNLVVPQGLNLESAQFHKDEKHHAIPGLTTTTCSRLQFWTADRTKTELGAFFGPLDPAEGASSWPSYLQDLARAGGKGEAAISALGGTIFYLRQALLESDVLALGRIEPLPGSAEACFEAPGKDGEEERDLYMVLDSAALENLEV